MAITLANIRSRVLARLHRKDLTQDQLDEFIQNAIRRIQRSLRTPISEGQAVATIPMGSDGRVNVPSDLLNLIWISVRGHELSERSFSEVNRYNYEFPQGSTHTEYYVRVGNQYIVAPVPLTGTNVDIYYYRDLAPLVNDNDTNALIDVAPDLVTYGALIDAADWSLDPDRMAIWNEGFTTTFAEIQAMAERDVLANASIGTCIPLMY
jgi:molybdopterin converting factor small subunit